MTAMRYWKGRQAIFAVDGGWKAAERFTAGLKSSGRSTLVGRVEAFAKALRGLDGRRRKP